MEDQEWIKQRLLDGSITGQQAFDLVTAKKQKPWEEKEWEKKRKERLESACTQCGSIEQPLVLQHLWQPRSLKTLHLLFKAKYMKEYEAKYPAPIIERDEPAGERDACPFCLCISIMFRKRTQDWRCGKCYQTFSVPAKKSVYTKEQNEAYQQIRTQVFSAWYHHFDELYKDHILKDSVLESIQDHQRYLSLVDITTFCKKCAYLWDVKRLKLCSVCKKEYVNCLLTIPCFSCRGKEYE